MTLNEEIPHPVLRAFREEEDVEKEEEMTAHWSRNQESYSITIFWIIYKLNKQAQWTRLNDL